MLSALKIINRRLRCGLELGLMLLMLQLMLQVGEANPMPWLSHNEASYDASLDPLVWSRPFVQDTVRRHRIAPQLSHHHYNLQHHYKPCAELFKRRRQQTLKWFRKHRLNRGSGRGSSSRSSSSGRGKTNYQKYLHRRRKLMLQTSAKQINRN